MTIPYNGTCKSNSDCEAGLYCVGIGLCCASATSRTLSNANCCEADAVPGVCATALCKDANGNNTVDCSTSCNSQGYCCDTCAQGCDGVACGTKGSCLNNACCDPPVIANGQCCETGATCAGSCLPSGDTCCLGEKICGEGYKCCQITNGGNPMTNGCDPSFGSLGGPICVRSGRNCHEYGACPV